jgi:rare lipoprotein A
MRQRIRENDAPALRLAALAGRVVIVSALALLVANCAKQTQRTAQQSREIGAFSDPKYGKASPRVVGMDEDAPKGGGRYQVGRPYMVAGRRYVPRERPVGYTATGNASWYGIAFHGRRTANGEVYDRKSISAAHPTMPLPSYARVTNLTNNHSIVVRVNDRGPYHGGRVLDVSERTADLLRFRHIGTARVKIDYLGPAALAGSDDQKLVASLSTDGPARAPGGTAPATMVASAAPLPAASPPSAAPASGGSLLSFAATAPEPAPRAVPAAPGTAPNAGGAARYTPVENAPHPPARPFDLETIAGAARPLPPGALPATAPTPPRRLATPEALPAYRPTDLAFVEMSDMRTRFGNGHPFSRIGEIEAWAPARAN